MEDNSSNSDDVIELDSLKKFTIPKRVKKTRELFEPTSTNSREFQHEILPIIQSSFKDRGSVKNFTFSGANIIHNLQLQNSYLERRKSMRADGYSEKEVQDSYAFLAVDTLDKARKICLDGLRVGNSKVSCLGNPDMAVCLCKHADLLRPMPFTHGQCCRLLIFKVIKGKVKTMMECRGSTEPLDPTPHYDCHISKTANVDLTCTPLSIAFESTQLFLYEYGDYDLEEQPRQILPYAMVEFRYLGDPRHRPSAAPKHTASWAGSTRPLKSPGSTGPRLPISSVPPTLHSTTMPNLPLRSLLPTPSHPPPIPGPPPSPIRPPSSSMYMPLASPITPTNTPSPQPPSPLEDPAQRPSYSTDYLKPVVTNVGKRRDGGGVVVWVGQLSSHGTQICDVELVSFMGNVRPACIGMQLNVSKRYTLEAVRSKLQAGCVRMSRDVETCQQNHFYNYCMLKPAGQAHLSQFNHIVSYLDRRRLGACVTLEEKSEVLLLSDSELTKQLGLGEFSKDRLHCIFISNKSRQGRILVDTPPQSVRSDTPESQGNAQAVDKLSLLQALGQGVAESNPAAPRRFSSSSADLPSPMPLVDTRTSPSPLSHSPSLSPFSAFKDTGHRGDSDLDSEVAAMFEEGFQKFIPPGSLVYKGSLVSSFTEQSFIQDRRNIDIAKGKKFANPKAVPPDPGWSGGTAAKVGMHRSVSFPSTTHSSIAIAPTTGRRSINAVTPESPFSKDPRLMLNMPPRAAQRPLGDTSGLSPQQQQHGSMDYQQHQQHSHPIPQPYPTAPPLPPHPQSSTWSSGQGVMAGTSSDKSHMNTPMSADPVMERAAIGGRGHWPSQGYPRPPPELHPHMPAVEGEIQGSRNPIADPRLHKRQPNTGNGSSSSGLVRGSYQPSPGHLGSPVNPLNALTAMATMDVKQEADMNAIHSVPSMPSGEAYVSPNTAQHSNLEQSPSLGRSLDTGAISTTNTTTTTTSISNQCSAVARPASPSPLQRQIPAGKVLQDTMMYGTPGINPCPKEGLFVDGEDEDLHCQRQQGLTDHSSVDTDTSIDSYSPSLLDKRLAALEAGLSDPCHDVDAEDSDHYDNKDWLESDEEEEDEDVLEEEMSDDLVDEIVRCAPLKAKAIRSQESSQESTDQSTFLDPNTVNLKISNGFDKINNTRQVETHWTPKSTHKYTSDEDLSQGTLPEETDSLQTSTAGTQLTPTLIPVETQVSPPHTVSMPAPAFLPITTSLSTPVSTHSSTEKPELHSDITPSPVEMPVTEADSMPEPALTPVIVSPHPQSQVPTPPSSSAVMIVPPSEESMLTVVTPVSTTAPGSHNQQQSCPPETPDQPLTTSLLHPLDNSESVQKEESDTESESDTETVPIKAETNNNCCDIVDLDSPMNSNIRAVKRPVKTIPMISMDRDGGKPGFLSGLDMDEPTDDIVPWPAYLHSLWSMSKRVGGCVPDFLPDTDVDLAKDCMGLLMTFTPCDMDLVNGDEYTEEGALAGALTYIMHTCHHTYTKEPETSQERDRRLIWQVGLHYLVPFQVHDERLISEADLAECESESEVSSAQLSSDNQVKHPPVDDSVCAGLNEHMLEIDVPDTKVMLANSLHPSSPSSHLLTKHTPDRLTSSGSTSAFSLSQQHQPKDMEREKWFSVGSEFMKSLDGFMKRKGNEEGTSSWRTEIQEQMEVEHSPHGGAAADDCPGMSGGTVSPFRERNALSYDKTHVYDSCDAFWAFGTERKGSTLIKTDAVSFNMPNITTSTLMENRKCDFTFGIGEPPRSDLITSAKVSGAIPQSDSESEKATYQQCESRKEMKHTSPCFWTAINTPPVTQGDIPGLSTVSSEKMKDSTSEANSREHQPLKEFPSVCVLSAKDMDSDECSTEFCKVLKPAQKIPICHTESLSLTLPSVTAESGGKASGHDGTGRVVRESPLGDKVLVPDQCSNQPMSMAEASGCCLEVEESAGARESDDSVSNLEEYPLLTSRDLKSFEERLPACVIKHEKGTRLSTSGTTAQERFQREATDLRQLENRARGLGERETFTGSGIKLRSSGEYSVGLAATNKLESVGENSRDVFNDPGGFLREAHSLSVASTVTTNTGRSCTAISKIASDKQSFVQNWVRRQSESKLVKHTFTTPVDVMPKELADEPRRNLSPPTEDIMKTAQEINEQEYLTSQKSDLSPFLSLPDLDKNFQLCKDSILNRNPSPPPLMPTTNISKQPLRGDRIVEADRKELRNPSPPAFGVRKSIASKDQPSQMTASSDAEMEVSAAIALKGSSMGRLVPCLQGNIRDRSYMSPLGSGKVLRSKSTSIKEANLYQSHAVTPPSTFASGKKSKKRTEKSSITKIVESSPRNKQASSKIQDTLGPISTESDDKSRGCFPLSVRGAKRHHKDTDTDRKKRKKTSPNEEDSVSSSKSKKKELEKTSILRKMKSLIKLASPSVRKQSSAARKTPRDNRWTKGRNSPRRTKFRGDGLPGKMPLHSSPRHSRSWRRERSPAVSCISRRSIKGHSKASTTQGKDSNHLSKQQQSLSYTNQELHVVEIEPSRNVTVISVKNEGSDSLLTSLGSVVVHASESPSKPVGELAISAQTTAPSPTQAEPHIQGSSDSVIQHKKSLCSIQEASNKVTTKVSLIKLEAVSSKRQPSSKDPLLSRSLHSSSKDASKSVDLSSSYCQSSPESQRGSRALPSSRHRSSSRDLATSLNRSNSTDVPSSMESRRRYDKKSPRSDNDKGHSCKERVHKSRRGTTKYHPYIRPESPKKSVSQKEKEEFFRIYTAHTDLHDLLQCLSRRNFASRKPYPGGILARNQQGPSAGLFTDYRFRRTSVQEIKDISCPRLRDAEDVHYTASEVTDLSSRRDAVQVLDGQVEEESKTKRKMAEDILGEEMEVYQSPSQDEESPKQGPSRKTRKTDSENKGKIYDNLVLNTMTQATENRDSSGGSGDEDDLKISSLPEDNNIMGKSKKWRLVPVEVPQEDFTYNAAHYRELPELLETEILASRDPRLSPGLPASSVYSRTLFLDSDEDDLNSQHSEVCDSPRQLDDEGKSLKIRVHVNPKFFPNACEASEFMKAAEKSLSTDGRRSKKGSKQTEYQVKSHDDHVQPSHTIDRYIDQSGDISDDPEDDQEKTVTQNKSTCRYKMTSPDRSSAKQEVQALVSQEPGTEDKERPTNSISNDSGGGVMWDDIAAYDEDDTELEPVDSPLTGWRACPDLIYPMSRFVKSAMAAASRKEPWNKFEDIVECGILELGNELEQVMKGDVPVPVCSYKHLPSLSVDTQLYSSMIESQVIRMVHLQILKEWITRKPLDRLIAGKLDASKLKRPDPILQLSSITNTVKDCTEDFHCSVFKLASGKNSNKTNGGVFKDVRSATEDTVEEVYGQVHLYMEFLLDKVSEKFPSLSNIPGHGTTRHRPDKLQLRTSSKEQIHKSHIPIKRKYESPDEITRSEHKNACHLPKLNMAVTVKNETVDNSMRAAMVDFKQDLDRVAIGPVVKIDSSNLTKKIKPEANSKRSSPKRICSERDDSIYSPYSPSYPTEREDLQETFTCDKAVTIEENKSLESKKKKRSRDERDKKQEREKKEKVEKRGKEGKESKVGLREKQLEADPSPDPSDRRRRRGKDVDRGSKYRNSSVKSNNSSDKHASTAEISGVAIIDKQLAAQFEEEHVQKTTETSGATEKPTKRRTYSERSLPDTDTNLTHHPHPKKSRFEMQCEASKAKANDMMKEILKQLHSKSFYVDAHLSDCSDLYCTEGLLPNFSVHFDPGVPPCEKSSNPSVLSWAFFNHFVHKFDNLFTRLWESPEDKNLFQSQVEEQVDIFLWALLLSYQEQYPKDNQNSASLSHMSSSQSVPSQCEQSTNEYGSVKNTDRCDDAMEITNEYGSADLGNEYGPADSTNEYGSSTDVNQTESSCGDGNQDHTTSVIADSLSEEGELLDGKGHDPKKGRGSKLLMAFKQAIEAKKRKPDDKSKPTPFKLNPVLAAKRAAPKHSKPLFKPSQIYEASAETESALKSSLYSGEKQTHVCLSIHKSIDMDSMLKQALAMFSAQARDYVLERIGADALNQLVAGILPSMHTTGFEKTDSNLLVYLLDLLYKERANSSQKTKDAQLALLRSSEEECHDTNKQPDSIGKVNLSRDFKSFGSSGSTSSLRAAVGTANKSHKEDEISCVHASPPVKEPTPEVEAPVFNVDTEHKKYDDSKPVLPKGDKFMAAFRQAMIAKKRAHKEGQAVGKYATSMSKICTTTTMARTKPSSIITTAEEDEASSKIMEALTSFSNSTTKTLLPPKLSDAMASDSVVRSIPTIGSVSRTESTVPEPMEEDSDPGEDNAISTGDNATLSYPSSSEIYSSQPVLYSSASNVSQQEAVSVFSAPPYYSTEATSSVASNPYPNSTAEDSSKSSLPSQASGIPLPGIGHSAPPPLPTVPPPASQPPEPPPPTYYQTPSAALPSTLASMHDEQMMQHYKQQIEAWQQNRQLPQPYPPLAAYTCPPQPPWPGYGPPLPHRPPLLPSPVAGAAPPQPPNTTAPTPHYNSPPPPPGAEPPPPGSWSSWPPPPGVSPQWPESSWGTSSWSQPS